MNRTVYLITTKVRKHYTLTTEQLFSKSKNRYISNARFVCFFILHDYYKMTTYQIAEQFGCSQGNVSQGCHKILNGNLGDVVEIRRKIIAKNSVK